MSFELSSSDDPPSIRFGNGLLIRPAAVGGWEVCGGVECWPLDEQEGWRAVALLEHQLEDVRAAFARIGGEDVPLARVVSAALTMTAYWADLALRWVANFTDAERRDIRPALRSLEAAPWADQKLRHTARRLAQNA